MLTETHCITIKKYSITLKDLKGFVWDIWLRIITVIQYTTHGSTDGYLSIQIKGKIIDIIVCCISDATSVCCCGYVSSYGRSWFKTFTSCLFCQGTLHLTIIPVVEFYLTCILILMLQSAWLSHCTLSAISGSMWSTQDFKNSELLDDEYGYTATAVPRAALQSALQGSRHGAVLGALTSRHCVPGLIPGHSVMCWSSLLLVLYSAPRGFSPGTPVFPSP